MTVDLSAVPGDMTIEVATRLKKATGIPRQNLVVCRSRSHSTPYVERMRLLLFTPRISAEERADL